MTYDTHCWELANFFVLASMPFVAGEDAAQYIKRVAVESHKLAQEIQRACDDWVQDIEEAKSKTT